MNTEQLEEKLVEVNGAKVVVTSYKIGDEYYCHVSNYDPGATIARAHATTKEEAIEVAVKKAAERILHKGRSN